MRKRSCVRDREIERERGRDSVKTFVCVCGRERDSVRMRKCSDVYERERDSLDVFVCIRERKRACKRKVLHKCIFAVLLRFIISYLKW